jgi:formate hydrogenlyase subunit 6/NADH:ubiquinone oxidoreductase subunit I
MLGWIWRGVRTGVVTTQYPRRPATMPGAYRGRVVVDADRCDPRACRVCADVCLPRAITVEHGVLRLDVGRCITCGYCVDACPAGALQLRNDFELAVRLRADLITEIAGEGDDDYLDAGRS